MAPAPSSTHDTPFDTSKPTPASSSRVLRSSTRLAADTSTTLASVPATASTPNLPQPQLRSRKRKTIASRESSPEETADSSKISPSKRRKRQRIVTTEQPQLPGPQLRRRVNRQISSMADSGSSIDHPGNADNETSITQSTSRRKSSRNKKVVQQEPVPSPQPTASSTRRSKKAGAKKTEDHPMKNAEETSKSNARRPVHEAKKADLSDDEDTGRRRVFDDDDDEGDYPFRENFLGTGGSSSGLSSTLRALSGMVSGISSRLREILNNLRQKDDPSVQLIALQELSEILLVSTEDNLSGHFSPDQFVKELVSLMQPNEMGEENPEMMLVACRCIANLMEALPPSTANVVYGGAVPILCQKLLEIHFIDLAEQALSTLEKISVEFPAAIVREGGLTACLTYLDFFATSTQRTAVTTAANCCRNIPQDSFPVIRDVMPILLNVLGSSDQKVVEQGSLCISRVVESFKYQQDKLEELVSPDLLKAIRRLLLPGTTNLIGPNIHTQFLRVLAITARASPTLSAELFKMNIVDTIFQILTGVSPPIGVENVASQIDSVLIMQALIHKPREQVYETLNFVCELLPGVHSDNLAWDNDLIEGSFSNDNVTAKVDSKSATSPNVKRIELLKECENELKRFALILLPTLTDAYSSTVNLGVRQKVLTAQLKMLSNLNRSILEEALRPVPFASYLASILSQQDHPSLVTLALQAAELLLVRLESIYRYQFYREGVMAEVQKLADQEPIVAGQKSKDPKANSERETSMNVDLSPENAEGIATPVEKDSPKEHSEDEQDHDDEEEDDDEPNDAPEDMSPSSSDSSFSDHNDTSQSLANSLRGYIISRAKQFLEVHENVKGRTMREKAAMILDKLKKLAKDIERCYLYEDDVDGRDIFTRLSSYFHSDALEGITSYELLHSGVVRMLLDVFSNANEPLKAKARKDFLQVFMTSPIEVKLGKQTQRIFSTPFNVLILKLQDLLSRAEHFEVLTVHHNALDSNRSSAASMLSKQIRLRLAADDDSETPHAYRNVILSIHAIVTFQYLDEYLRPRLCMSERPRSARHREGVSNALAAFAAATGLQNPATHRLVDRIQATNGDNPHPPKLPSASNPGSSRKDSKNRNPPPGADEVSLDEKSKSNRRSSRRHRPSIQATSEDDNKTPNRIQSPLECADERQLSDEDDLDDSNALDTIVDDLEDDMEENLPEPTAVNMEVAPTGKVTARKDDGTRISTPSQALASLSSTSSSRSRDLLTASLSPAMANRAMTYAAAIRSVPQDWHLEYTINDQPVTKQTTIYQGVLSSKANAADFTSRNIWSAVHTVKFKKVRGPPPAAPSPLTPQPSSSSSVEETPSDLPISLHEYSETSNILRLLNILHELNTNLDDVLDESKEALRLNPEPASQFINTKLTAKLNRQLEEPLIVASKSLPSWSHDLARLYPFLFPFETRHLFLQSTSFGYHRSISRWQGAQSGEESRRDRHREDPPWLLRLPRQKVRISRERILDSAIKVIELYGASPSILEVEYFDEVGTGLGPTLEFYSTVSKEFSLKRISLWRESESDADNDYVFGKLGLFPAPMSEEHAESENGKKTLHYFKMLGKFIARSMLDSRIIDVSLNPTFFRICNHQSTVPLSLGAVKTVDHQLAKSLKLVKQFALAKKQIDDNFQMSDARKALAAAELKSIGARVENLSLDFTLPGYPNIDLVKNGSDVSVTIDNVGVYVEKVIDMTLGRGVQRQVEAFRAGFSQVFPYSALRAFTPNELVMLFGRIEEDWTIETLLDSVKADHGFNMDSKSVRNLLHIMSELSPSQRRSFLQFVTGSPKLPIGGFKSLTPMFTVVCKPSEPPYSSDDFLISVMTCANYLKLPDYTSIDILRQRLFTAIEEGQGAFLLS